MCELVRVSGICLKVKLLGEVKIKTRVYKRVCSCPKPLKGMLDNAKMFVIRTLKVPFRGFRGKLKTIAYRISVYNNHRGQLIRRVCLVPQFFLHEERIFHRHV